MTMSARAKPVPDKDHCDGWEAEFCCTLCEWYGGGDCESCDPWDI